MSGPSPRTYQALAIKVGLETWARHKIKVNTHYTPKAMMAKASEITGKRFKAQDYLGAAKALASWVAREKDQGRG